MIWLVVECLFGCLQTPQNLTRTAAVRKDVANFVLTKETTTDELVGLFKALELKDLAKDFRNHAINGEKLSVMDTSSAKALMSDLRAAYKLKPNSVEIKVLFANGRLFDKTGKDSSSSNFFAFIFN